MDFKISGLEEMQRELQTAIEAFDSLSGEFASVTFNPSDLSSIEAAITEADRAVDAKLAPFRGNAMVEAVAEDLKANFRQQLYDRAAEARAGGQEGKSEMPQPNTAIFRQIQNTITDLRAADYNGFDNCIQKLSRQLHSPELDAISGRLTEGIDIHSWMEAGHSTHGGMVGNATITWPIEHEKELGTKILLIDHFAAHNDAALNYAHRFYNAGNRVTDNLQNLVRRMIVPFAMDYIIYAQSALGMPEIASPHEQASKMSRKVFIVHGHDEGAREAVARLLEKLGFEAIILHEQANQGRTIIEKFESHADVGFAVILLTPDDIGGASNGPQHPRARQNVLLELGYFIGRLGRGKVCAIKAGELEIPSDIIGVVWTQYDAHGAWRGALAKELEAAGFEIDWNKVMRG